MVVRDRSSANGERRKRRERSDTRPQEIVAAAFEEFAANGYAATRLEDVASRAKVSKGLPYLYFKTKEELFKAVIRSVIIAAVRRHARAHADNGFVVRGVPQRTVPLFHSGARYVAPRVDRAAC